MWVMDVNTMAKLIIKEQIGLKRVIRQKHRNKNLS